MSANAQQAPWGAPPMAAPAEDTLRTDYPFVLPRGYVDARGAVHRSGVMRLATARDEIAPQTDPRVRANPAFLNVLLLERTVTSLGDLSDVDSSVIEGLFASDLAFLQDLYRRINQEGNTQAQVACPQCGAGFAVDIAGGQPGE